MEYSKPEVSVLGDANRMIQGSKLPPGESGDPDQHGPNDFELED
jgi:hypothetical protein